MQHGKPPFLSEPQIEEAARLFAILSEPSRLRLIKCLMAGPQTVGRLVVELGLRQGSVSKQLGILHAARLVKRDRQGNFISYALADPILEPLCKLVFDRMQRVAREHARVAGLKLR